MSLLLAGALCVLLALVPVGLFTAMQLASITVQNHKPMWLLRHEAMNSQGATVTAALKEIQHRVNTKQIGLVEVDSLIHETLRRQADLSLAWEPAWGDLVEEVHVQGLLDAARWEQYLTQAAEHTVILVLRPKIRVGDVFPYRMQYTGARCGNKMKHWVKTTNIDSPQIGPLPHYPTGKGGFGTNLCVTTSGASSSTYQLTKKQWEVLEHIPGTLPVKLEVEFTISQNYGGTVEVRFKRTLTGQVEIVPVSESTTKEVVDEKQRSAMEKAVKVIRAEEEQKGRLAVVIALEKPPIGVAYEVFAQIGNQRSKIGRLNIKPGGQTQWSISANVEFGQADKVDFELVPSAQGAADTVDVFDYWGEPMWFREVPVQRLARPTQPGTP